MILAFIICKVLTKEIETVGINYNLEVPNNLESDTTLGNRGQVYVKYDDYNFYPKYIVHYSWSTNICSTTTHLFEHFSLFD